MSTPSLKRSTVDPLHQAMPKKKPSLSLPTLPIPTGPSVKSTKAKALDKKSQQRYTSKKKAGPKVILLTAPSLFPPI